jgi:hypothetical protein
VFLLLWDLTDPDKPGGDTAKFQQLQASYNEILKRKAESAEAEKAINGGDSDAEEDEEDEDKDMEKKGKGKKSKSKMESEREKAERVLADLATVLEEVKAVSFFIILSSLTCHHSYPYHYHYEDIFFQKQSRILSSEITKNIIKRSLLYWLT